ncbi:MAG: sulfotransferase [Candidatus Paceibacterota bacterium]
MNKLNIKKPNFFIVGAPRTGTTSLSIYLRDHPDIFFSIPKEPHYFSHDLGNFRKITKEEDYLNIFQGAENYKAVGEGSTWYLFSEDAIQRILAFNPEAKFIVMVRNPIDIFHSRFYLSRYFFDETAKSPEKAWRLRDDRKKGKNVPLICSSPKLLYHGEVSKLGKQLEHLYHFVEKDKVKVIVFDDFIKDTQKVYKEVLNFLNLKYDGRTNFPVYNSRYTFKYRLVSLLAIFLHKYINFSDKLFKWNIKKVKKEPLNEDLENELKDYFKEDVKKLSSLLGRDLTYWVD